MRPDKRTGQQSVETTVTEMKRRVRTELDRLVSRRAGRSTRANDKREFEEKWIRTGMAKREEVRIEHVRSHTGVRGNEAADKLAALGAQIQDGHRIVERNSHEPPMLDTEYKDNG